VSTIFFFEFACMLGGLLLQINLPGECFNFVWGLGIHNCFQNRFVSELRAFPTHFPSILYFIFSKSHFFILTTNFYKTLPIPFSILQYIILKYYKIILFLYIFFTLQPNPRQPINHNLNKPISSNHP
jgi:hypothetical protein